MNNAPTIPKHPKLSEAEDYTLLRQRGIELIQQLGSALWTDYNIHDPGITLLELLCYAQTELGYQLGFSIEDLLALFPGQQLNFDEQTFYTARTMLTVNPWTTNDFRKQLIDPMGVRNAWLECRQCSCDFTLYANCLKSVLQYEKTEHPVRIRGFYDVLLELDSDAVNGDLNSGKVFNRLTFVSGGLFTNATVELRFPPWHQAAASIDKFSSFIKPKSFLEPNGITIVSISGNPLQTVDVPDEQLYKALRNPLYATVEISFHAIGGAPLQTTTLKNVPLKVWYRNDEDRKAITVAQLRAMLADTSKLSVVNRYLAQLKAAAGVVEAATVALHQHRNLAEDYCTISTVPVEDVAVCADIEMSAEADIEAVLGQAYWLIDQYMSPIVPFYTLQQLLDRNTPAEDIFHGPKLNHGFILDADLDKAQLKTKLFTSDIINLLMDIPGITAVKNITLARYNAVGKLVESQPWELAVTPGHQPRFYIHASKVLVYKNGLPFLPDPDELNDTLLLWKGRNAQNKLIQPQNDLPVPVGAYVDLETYYPVQYALPETYGVGPHGLPNPVSDARRAQAKQLKAYLLVFEHLLATYVQQLNHFRDLLSINPAVQHTYFAYVFREDVLAGVDNLYNSVTEQSLVNLLEDESGFVRRRNGFLDHLLSRFAESFSDYTLTLYSAMGSHTRAGAELIGEKISFLEALPFISTNRARSFNYKDETTVCDSRNIAGLQERIRVLLGLNGLASSFSYVTTGNATTRTWEGHWELNDGNTLLQSPPVTDQPTEYALQQKLYQLSRKAAEVLADPASVVVVEAEPGVFAVHLKRGTNTLAHTPATFGTLVDADAHAQLVRNLVERIQRAEQIYVVEHILLRPHNQPSTLIKDGDPLLPICIGPDCHLCGEEDPYSFRITLVLNGEQGLANGGIAFRRFAEKTIRQEVPAHLGVKICWVSEAQLKTFGGLWCDWLAELSKAEPKPLPLSQKLKALLDEFTILKSVYPKATLHDCVDGDDENRVYLNQTVI
ncbi:hypothetical protein GCM10023189_35810 [Nibrella saemangeumensis]|uniref:Baseplate J-like protein n=1 Tax=Nibrella saemangeumensis TaxID=1084526 RepID=A0ABP8N7H7_9BACT